MIDSDEYYLEGLEEVKQGNLKDAHSSFKKALALYSGNRKAAEELEKLRRDKPLMIGGYEIDLKSKEPITLAFKSESIKKIFDFVSRLTGINFVFDSDVRDVRTSILLKDATFQQALDLLLTTNNLAKKVVNENTIVIYPDTPAKIKQYEEMLIRVFYLQNIDSKQAVNLVRTMIRARDIYVHAERNALVVRARPDTIALAEKLIAATDLADAEVMLAVDIMEVSRDGLTNLGINYPDSVTLSVPDKNASPGPAPGDFISLEDLNILSSEDLLVTIPPTVINFAEEDLDVELLANPRIRVKNNEKASIHIGEKVPIITATISATASLTTESVSYQDVGLKLVVEPIVRPNDEIDLKLKLEVSSLGAKTVTNNNSVVYQIGTRNAETTLRLYDGETQVIGGLITDEERTTKVKIPGFGDLPVIGRLFSNHDTSEVKSDILLSITPHIVRSVEVPDEELLEIWSGREDAPMARSEHPADYEPLDEELIAPQGTSDEMPRVFEGFDDAQKTTLPPPPPLPPGLEEMAPPHMNQAP